MNNYQPLFKEKDIINKLCKIYNIEKLIDIKNNLIIKENNNKLSYLIILESYFILIIYNQIYNKWRIIIRNQNIIILDIKTKENYKIIKYELNDYIFFNVKKDNLKTLLFTINKKDLLLLLNSKFFGFKLNEKINKFYIVSNLL